MELDREQWHEFQATWPAVFGEPWPVKRWLVVYSTDSVAGRYACGVCNKLLDPYYCIERRQVVDKIYHLFPQEQEHDWISMLACFECARQIAD